MLMIPAKQFRKRRGQTKPRPTQAPPVALTLVAAVFDNGSDIPAVVLTFDRPIDVSGLVAATIRVFQGGGSGFIFDGTGRRALLGANVVSVEMGAGDDYFGPSVTLSVG